MRKHLPVRGVPLICEDKRLRWTPRMLVLAAVLMAWHSAATMREAFAAARENVVAMYATRRRPGKSLGGFLKTLQKRSDQLLAEVTASLRSSLRGLAGKDWRWRDWVVLGVDGSRVNCPRTAANEVTLGCAGRQKTGPQLQLTTLYHVFTGVPWCWRRGSGTTAERSQLRDMLKDLPKNTLLLADAGFTGYDLMRELMAAGHSFVIRAGCNMTLLRELGYTVEASRETAYLWPLNRRRLPPLTLRLIQVERDGKRMALLTNLPAAVLSKAEATMLYRQRWELEVMFRSLKQTMEKRTLRGDTPSCAAVELDWALVGLWLLGLMTIEARGLKASWPAAKAPSSPAKAPSSPAKAPSSLAKTPSSPAKTPSSPAEAPWSPAKAQAAVREALRRCKQRVHRHALRNKLKQAVRDHYERKGSKKARNWPHKKRERPPGLPKTRKATAQEIAAAQAFSDKKEAA